MKGYKAFDSNLKCRGFQYEKENQLKRQWDGDGDKHD